MEVFERHRDRDLLMLGEIEGAKRAADALEATATPATQQEVDDKVRQHMEAASVIRFRLSQIEVTASVANIPGMMYKPRTILAWVREFGKLGAYLKRDGQGVSERE